LSDVFLLGAGFSKAISDKMPLLVDLSVALREEIDLPDYVTNLGDNVEYLMTYLSQDQPWVSVDGNLVHRAKFLRLTRAIGALINHRTSDVLQANCPEWLVKLVHWWHTERAHVITLNYDTLAKGLQGSLRPIGGVIYLRLKSIPFRSPTLAGDLSGVITMFRPLHYTSSITL